MPKGLLISGNRVAGMVNPGLESSGQLKIEGWHNDVASAMARRNIEMCE